MSTWRPSRQYVSWRGTLGTVAQTQKPPFATPYFHSRTLSTRPALSNSVAIPCTRSST
jgi:hypothetical protein